MSECCETKNNHSDQKASNGSVPATVAAHKNPEMKPAAGHAYGQGANVK